MAGTETKRIIELTEASTVQSGDYFPIDSASRGTKKVPTDALATSAALTAETNARTEAITAEQTAREQADEQMSERMDGIEEQTALIQNPTKTLSGALVSFTDGAAMPMVACSVEIVPKQSGSGTPSPSNVRPISGWESVNANVSGVNVWDEVWELGDLNTNNGANYPSTDRIRSKNYVPILPSTTYYNSCAKSIGICFYDENKAFIAPNIVATANTTFTTYANARYMRFYASPAYGTTYNNDISINYPSTDHEYHAYTGTTTPVNLGRTVYGGTLDVVSGVLKVDKGIFDLGSLTWTYNSTYSVFIGYTPTDSAPINDARNLTAISSMYENKTGVALSALSNGQFVINTTAISSSTKRIGIKNTAYTDATAFKTAMNGQTIVYPLATPTTYTLTGQEVDTLLGENNVWADSGDVEITYRRDISIVLENLENALSGSNSLNAMMMSAPTESTAEEPTEDEAEDDMR